MRTYRGMEGDEAGSRGTEEIWLILEIGCLRLLPDELFLKRA